MVGDEGVLLSLSTVLETTGGGSGQGCEAVAAFSSVFLPTPLTLRTGGSKNLGAISCGGARQERIVVSS